MRNRKFTTKLITAGATEDSPLYKPLPRLESELLKSK
jgi:hypothetical protein